MNGGRQTSVQCCVSMQCWWRHISTCTWLTRICMWYLVRRRNAEVMTTCVINWVACLLVTWLFQIMLISNLVFRICFSERRNRRWHFDFVCLRSRTYIATLGPLCWLNASCFPRDVAFKEPVTIYFYIQIHRSRAIMLFAAIKPAQLQIVCTSFDWVHAENYPCHNYLIDEVTHIFVSV
jgi:hypothetical protein